MKDGKGELRLLTLAEAATMLRISKRTALRLIQKRKRKMPAFKIGGQWRLRENRLKKWVEEQE